MLSTYLIKVNFMKFKELIDYALIYEESDPKLVAAKLSKKSEYFKNNGNEFKFVLNNLIAEAKNNNGKIPIGNGKFINTKNEKELNTFVLNIKNHLNVNSSLAKLAIENALDDFKNYFK